MKFLDFFRRPSDRDRFAQSVIRRAREKGWPHKIAYDREGFRLECGPNSGKFFLHNVYKDWIESEPHAKERELDRIASAIFELKDSSDLASSLPTLLPAIRNRRDLECQWLDPALGTERDAWDGAIQPLCGAIAITVAVDQAATLSLVGAKTLRTWEMSLAPLLDRAIANLREISPISFERDPGGFYVSQYNDQYDCSRLLIPEIFDRLSLRGMPVIILVARNGMVVAGSEDVPALLAMAKFADEQIEKATRPTSYLPLVRRGDAWVVFEPEDPALGPIRDLRAKQMLWDYECQRELLQGYCDRASRDVWVGKIEANKFGSQVYTFSTWTQGVSTLLPRTDAVAIHTGEASRWLIRSWDDFWAVCGDALVDEGLYPSRFLTPAFMTESQLARLDAEFSVPVWLPPPAKDAHLIG